jgi:hypothetical protein
MMTLCGGVMKDVLSMVLWSLCVVSDVIYMNMRDSLLFLCVADDVMLREHVVTLDDFCVLRVMSDYSNI